MSRAVSPIKSKLIAGSQALDFGCGPGPAIDHILKNHGINCENYDLLFFPDGINNVEYDLIFATECLEHFHNPADGMTKLLMLLKKGGILSIMTALHIGLDHMDEWYYSRDPTHVIFFSYRTMEWLAENCNLNMICTDNKRVFIYQK